MSFELPDLDTRDSAALQAELIRRIPQFTRLWTDYNDSDPGITLLQLLCWIGESLLYQNNAIPIQADQNFLRDVLGLAFTSNTTPYSEAAEKDFDFAFQGLRDVLGQIEAGVTLTRAQLQHAVLDYRDTPYLALSLSDVQALALQTNAMIDAQQSASQDSSKTVLRVRRADALVSGEATNAYVLSDAAWSYQLIDPTDAGAPPPPGSRRSVLVLQPPLGQAAADAAQAEKTLLDSVRTYVSPRVLLGNRVNVRAAQLTDINLDVSVRCPPNVVLKTVLTALMNTLFAYFQPGERWAYDRPPELEDLQHVIESVPGVSGMDGMQWSYAPSAQLGWLAQLNVNALLADLPPGTPAMLYRGLPRVRCISLQARNAA
ncbi:hypothetical protein [Dyella sp. M7H15-1]|uniref:hypothetical protein n=1 Tax=Dyella sp. M7H15-1 TaxID=2501295 RepID=UPI0013E8C059|nr:hypothetical protein [Dyella sp. M7H15-1]